MMALSEAGSRFNGIGSLIAAPKRMATRGRVLLWIGVAAVIWALAIIVGRVVNSDAPGVTMRVLGQTNMDAQTYCLILVSNITRHTQSGGAAMQARQTTGSPPMITSFRLEPHSWQVVWVVVPTNGSSTVRLSGCRRRSDWESWWTMHVMRKHPAEVGGGYYMEAKVD